MKKNILAIVILAATLVNITLSAIILFIIVPKAQRTDALIQKIVSIIDLELENPPAADYAEVPFADRVTQTLSAKVTANLRSEEGETKVRYAQVDVTFILNSKAAGYSKIQPKIAEQETFISGVVMDKVSQYTASEVQLHKEEIEKELLTYFRGYFESSDFLVGVSLNILCN